MADFWAKFGEIWARYLVHIFDITVVSYIIYRMLLYLKGTRGFQVLKGILILFIATVVARILRFPTLSWILRGFWIAGIVAIVIVLQPEIRNLLARLGSGRFSRFVFREEYPFLTQLIEGLKIIKENGWGALIVIQQNIGLKTFIDTGVKINGEITKELLESIFSPFSPLHDGAVIIQEDKIIAAGCILPLTEMVEEDSLMGTRHRAGIGISEVTDAWAIILSQQTGRISLAREGKLKLIKDFETLEKELREFYLKKSRALFAKEQSEKNEK